MEKDYCKGGDCKKKKSYSLIILGVILVAMIVVSAVIVQKNNLQEEQQGYLKILEQKLDEIDAGDNNQLPDVEYTLEDVVSNKTENVPEGTSLFLSPASASVPNCKEIAVKVKIKTNGKGSKGADAFVMYNSKDVEIVDLIPGNVFDFYPPYQVKDEKVFLSGINMQADYTTANPNGDEFWTIVLKGKPNVRSTKLKFDFTPNGTTDSNISATDGQSDILEKVNETNLNFVDQGYCAGW